MCLSISGRWHALELSRVKVRRLKLWPGLVSIAVDAMQDITSLEPELLLVVEMAGFSVRSIICKTGGSDHVGVSFALFESCSYTASSRIKRES